MEIRDNLKMLFPPVITGIYSLLVVMGGVIGYVQAHSYASLYMGLAFGISLSLCSLLMLKGKKAAYLVALVLMCILALFFCYRFALTQKFMPAGLMLVLSCASGLLLFLKRPASLS
jgi:uncharacterized membrane protein (UPF0136 family)